MVKGTKGPHNNDSTCVRGQKQADVIIRNERVAKMECIALSGDTNMCSF